MKKLFFRFDFSPKIKKFLTTLHNTQEQAILWIIRQLLPFLFVEEISELVFFLVII